MECKKESNLKGCTCSYPGCEHKGICCECVTRHRERNQIPACFFPKYVEKEFDRSVERFINSKA